MNKIIIRSDRTEEFFAPQNKTKRGARVYGVPVSREIAHYVDDVFADASRQRLVSMFFGGNGSVLGGDDFVEDDFDFVLPEDGEI